MRTFIITLAACICCVSGYPRTYGEDSASRRSVPARDRYKLHRFQQIDRVPATRPQSVDRSPATDSGLIDPAVIQVQHAEPAEVAPLPPEFRLAQSEFLDDLLDDSKKDSAEVPATTPPPPSEAAQAPAAATPVEDLPPEDVAPNEPGLDLVKPDPSAAAEPVRPLVVPNAIPSTESAVQAQEDRRRSLANQPYTLGGILDDEEDEMEKRCEQEFCQRMWQCAGGRNLSCFGRWRRGACRHLHNLRYGSNRYQEYNSMGDFQCSNGIPNNELGPEAWGATGMPAEQAWDPMVVGESAGTEPIWMDEATINGPMNAALDAAIAP